MEKNNIFSYKLILLALILTLLTSCAISNEGSTDYRYIKRSSDTQQSTKVKYIKPSEITKHVIKPKDALVISLKQVFIKDFTEMRSPMRLARNEPANGEIAVVVNAFEIGKGEAVNFGPDGKKNARVVFYSDDVWEGQFLNLSNLSTIYGPLTYDGGPFVLDLYVIEMDTPGAQLRQLLSNLAAIGATFYPPAAPVAGPLAQLAGTLIKDDQDDRAYHYTAEFKPLGGGDPDLNSGILLTGDYVFIREKNRYISTNWNELDLDEKNGRLVFNTKKEGKLHCVPDGDRNYPSDCYYRDNSYVVVEINTTESALQNDRTQMIFQALSDSVFSNSAPILNSPIPEEALGKLADEVKKSRLADNMNKQLKILNNSNDPIRRSTALNRFMNIWTQKDNKGNPIEIGGKDIEHIEDLLATKLSKCKKNGQNEIMSMMIKLRDRKTFNIENNQDILNALSCE